jgi:hypothetical protein
MQTTFTEIWVVDLARHPERLRASGHSVDLWK